MGKKSKKERGGICICIFVKEAKRIPEEILGKVSIAVSV